MWLSIYRVFISPIVLLCVTLSIDLSSIASLESLGLPTCVKTLKICLKGVEKFQEAYKG